MKQEIDEIRRSAAAAKQRKEQEEADRLTRYMNTVDTEASRLFALLTKELTEYVSKDPDSNVVKLMVTTYNVPAKIQHAYHDAVARAVATRFVTEGFSVDLHSTTHVEERSAERYGESAAPSYSSTALVLTL